MFIALGFELDKMEWPPMLKEKNLQKPKSEHSSSREYQFHNFIRTFTLHFLDAHAKHQKVNPILREFSKIPIYLIVV